MHLQKSYDGLVDIQDAIAAIRSRGIYAVYPSNREKIIALLDVRRRSDEVLVLLNVSHKVIHELFDSQAGRGTFVLLVVVWIDAVTGISASRQKPIGSANRSRVTHERQWYDLPVQICANAWRYDLDDTDVGVL